MRAAFEKHHGETEGQVERLEQIFELIDKPARGKTCDAIQFILAQGKQIMQEYKGCEVLDAGMLAATQAVEHYEISNYGTLKQRAQQFGMKDAVRLLDQMLQEEKAAGGKVAGGKAAGGKEDRPEPDLACGSGRQPRRGGLAYKSGALRGIRGQSTMQRADRCAGLPHTIQLKVARANVKFSRR